MAKIISIANHKGGVAKTTSSINIGAALNKLGKKVLLIDFDPQSNLSQSLGFIDNPKNIYNSLVDNTTPLEPLQIAEGFDIVPATIDLSGAEIELISEPGREFFLRDLLEPLQDQYDYIIIDCAPSLALLTLNALTASDEVLIPLQAQYLATQGLTKLMEIVGKIKQRLNKKLVIGGIFITQYDHRKTLNREVVEIIKDKFENYIFESKIRDNVALAEAPTAEQDIFRYSEKSNGAKDYLALATEFLHK
jgi:chromosome partitioning protein